MYVTQEKRKKNLFGSVPWANGYNLKFRRTFGRTILATSGVSKKIRKNLTKPKLHLNFEKVIPKHWKLYIRTLKTLHPSFENAISELLKRYIRTSKRYIRTVKTLYPNFKTLYPNCENVISKLWNRCIRSLKTLHPIKNLIKLIKSVISLIFKKASAIVCVLYEKRLLKNSFWVLWVFLWVFFGSINVILILTIESLCRFQKSCLLLSFSAIWDFVRKKIDFLQHIRFSNVFSSEKTSSEVPLWVFLALCNN